VGDWDINSVENFKLCGWLGHSLKFVLMLLAVGGRDRRCVYEDGDSEDLSLRDMVSLQFSDLYVSADDGSQTGSGV
jgi:hypothetical protein